MKPFGKYLVLERIGRGGMAEVFLARVAGPMGVSRYVAIKQVLQNLSEDQGLADMFIDEARLSSRLSHPAIVQIQDFGVEEGRYFLAMEYVEGQDLREVLKATLAAHQKIPLECVLYIGAQLARGLDYAHALADARGAPLAIVHRDVSPANIIISYGGDVKLADFGVARAASRIVATHSGSVKGKTRYMSPEQARSEEVDGRSDLFSLGSVLYEALTLKPAYAGRSDYDSLQLVQRGMSAAQLAEEDLPPDVQKVLVRAFGVDRRDRFQRGNEMAEALELALRTRQPTFGAPNLAACLESLFSAERAARRARMMAYDVSGQAPIDVESRSPLRGDHEETIPAVSPGTPMRKPAPTSRWRLYAAGVALIAATAGAAVLARSSHVDEPTPSVREAAAPGRMVIESSPAGAEVSFDGVRLAARTPTTVEHVASAQPHVVQLSLRGYREEVASLRLAPGEERRFTRTLTGEPRSLTISSSTSGAEVIVDGKSLGHTPLPWTTTIGAHHAIELHKPGMAPWRQEIDVGPDTPAQLNAELTQVVESGFGTLNLQTVPWSNVSIDGKPMGQAPIQNLRLSAGAHRVVLQNPGLQPTKLRVDIVRNQTLTKRVTLGPGGS